MTEKYIQWLLGHRWIMIVLSLVVPMACATGFAYFSFDADYKVFFKKDYPQVKALDQLHDTFGKSDNVLFLIEPTPADSSQRNVFEKETLKAIQELTEKSWTLPNVARVESVTNYQYSRSYLDELIVTDLVPSAIGLSSDELEDIKNVALSEPGLVNRLVSPDGAVTAINITMNFPDGDNQVILEASQTFKSLREEFEAKYTDINIYQTGMVSMTAAFTDVIVEDMTGLFPLMFLVITVLSVLLIRSFWAIVGLFVVMHLAIIAAIGIASFLGWPLTPPSSSAPNMIMTIVFADIIHFIVIYGRARKLGVSSDEAVAESIRLNLQPLTLIAATTSVGFMTMNLSDSPPFHDLGNMVAIGVVAAFLLTFTFFPALLLIRPPNIKATSKVDKYSLALATFVINNRKPIVVGFPVVCLILGGFLLKNELNDQFVKYFDESNEFRVHTEKTMETLTGIYSMEFILHADGADGIANPSYLSTVDRFAQWFRSREETNFVGAFSDVIKQINKSLNGDDHFTIPTEQSTILQYLLLYEMSLPYGHDLNNQINVDKSATRFSVNLHNLSTMQMRSLEADAMTWLAVNMSEGSFSNAASPTVMFSHISETNTRAMIMASIIALALVSFVLVFVTQSFRLGLVSLIPNFLPAIVAFGLWGIFVGEVGIAISIASVMTLGLIVNDTIHFLSKFNHGVRVLAYGCEDAIRYAYLNVATALLFTTVILGCGFAVLSFSSFEMNSGMGLLSAITIFAAFILDILFLPALLMTFFDRSAEVAKSTSVKPTFGESIYDQ